MKNAKNSLRKNKGKLSKDDYSEYLKLYDNWVSANGNKTAKKEKLKGLQALYKKSIYSLSKK